MKTLEIVNAERQPLAHITWNPPGTLTVEAKESDIKEAVSALVSDLAHNGIAIRSGGAVEHEGQTYFVEEGQIVRLNDERFLPALQETLYKYSINGQRVFGLLKES